MSNYERMKDYNRLIKKFNFLKQTQNKTITEENSVCSVVYNNNINNLLTNNTESKDNLKLINTEQSNDLKSINNEKEFNDSICYIDLNKEVNTFTENSIKLENVDKNIIKNNKDHKFIQHHSTQSKPKLSLKKFIYLKEKPLLIILNYLLYDYKQIFAIDILRKIYYNILLIYYTNVVLDFKEVFNNKLSLIETEFDFLTLKETYSAYNLVTLKKNSIPLIENKIIFKVNENYSLSHKAVGISVTYSYYKTSKPSVTYISYWKIDLCKLKDNKTIILTSEVEVFNQKTLRQCYTNSINQISSNDMVIIYFPLISKEGFILGNSVKWRIHEDIRIDAIERISLSEHIVTSWKSINQFSKSKYISNMIANLYSKCFDVISIEYDILKYYHFKVLLKAKTIGIIDKNKYFNFKLEIISKSKQLSYYTVISNTSNLNVPRNTITMMLGDQLLLYLDEIFN